MLQCSNIERNDLAASSQRNFVALASRFDHPVKKSERLTLQFGSD
jgi:hypothetical protein